MTDLEKHVNQPGRDKLVKKVREKINELGITYIYFQFISVTGRIVGKSNLYRKGPSGGLGCLTPDSFPIFDRFFENVYMIADANHGYKMIGVGHLVAQEILGQESELLKPFRFNRYAKGELHPTSNSPFPWS